MAVSPWMRWTPVDVSCWVDQTLGLPQYADAFEASQVDGPTLLELTEEILEEVLLVRNPLHRKKIIAHAKLLDVMQGPGASTALALAPAATSASAVAAAVARCQAAAFHPAPREDYRFHGNEEDGASSSGTPPFSSGGGDAPAGTDASTADSLAAAHYREQQMQQPRQRRHSLLESGAEGSGGTRAAPGGATAQRAAMRRSHSEDLAVMSQFDSSVREASRRRGLCGACPAAAQRLSASVTSSMLSPRRAPSATRSPGMSFSRASYSGQGVRETVLSPRPQAQRSVAEQSTSTFVRPTGKFWNDVKTASPRATFGKARRDAQPLPQGLGQSLLSGAGGGTAPAPLHATAGATGVWQPPSVSSWSRRKPGGFMGGAARFTRAGWNCPSWLQDEAR